MASTYSLSSSSFPDDIRVLHFRGREAISTLYEYVIDLHIPRGDDLDLEDAVGSNATFTIDPGGDGEPIRTHGILAGVRHMLEVDGKAIARTHLVPLAWHLGQSEHSRVFVKKKLPEIIDSVLEAAGLTANDYELRIARDLPVEEHVCQYRESDLAFLERWFEREGLFYFFEHRDSDAKLVITDVSPDTSLLKDAIRYWPLSDQDHSAGQCLDSFACERVALPARVTLRDYDYAKPKLDVKSQSDVWKGGQAERVRLGERFFTPADGERLSKVKAESLLARQEIVHASGSALGLRAGTVFELDQHPRAAFNKKYLITRLEHAGSDPVGLSEALRRLLGVDSTDAYRASIEAIDRATPYRAQSTSAWPRIYSTELAHVDGEADSEYAQIDDQGRYLVRMMFDEGDAEAGKASTWVRMAQPHGGAKEGFHFPLRKGTEVLITFLGGDPDRPVIGAVVPNAEKPSVVTKTDHTKNRLFTGGGNQLEIDDRKDKEYVHWYTPREKTTVHLGEPRKLKADGAPSPTEESAALGLLTNGSSVYSVGANWDITVGGFKSETIHGKVTETYESTKNETVTGALTEIYKAQKKETVQGLVKETYLASQETTVTGGWTLDVTAGLKEHAATHNYTVDGTLTGTVGGAVTWNAGPTTATVASQTTTISGSHVETVGGGENRVLAGAANWLHGGPTTWTSGGPWTVVSGGPITMMAPSISLLQPQQSTVGASVLETLGIEYKDAKVSVTVTGAKIDLPVLQVAIVPFKVDLRGIFMQNVGINAWQGQMKAQIANLFTMA